MYQTEIDVFSDLCYYSLTTLLGTQTLGEEYCDIMQIKSSSNTFPSLPVSKRFWHPHSLTATFFDRSRSTDTNNPLNHYIIASVRSRLLACVDSVYLLKRSSGTQTADETPPSTTSTSSWSSLGCYAFRGTAS